MGGSRIFFEQPIEPKGGAAADSRPSIFDLIHMEPIWADMGYIRAHLGPYGPTHHVVCNASTPLEKETPPYKGGSLFPRG